MAEGKLTIKCKRFDYSGDDIIYTGEHAQLNPDDDSSDWILRKFSYTGSDITKEQIKEGSWTNRTIGWD
jgi:hypothetical protein